MDFLVVSVMNVWRIPDVKMGTAQKRFNAFVMKDGVDSSVIKVSWKVSILTLFQYESRNKNAIDILRM